MLMVVVIVVGASAIVVALWPLSRTTTAGKLIMSLPSPGTSLYLILFAETIKKPLDLRDSVFDKRPRMTDLRYLVLPGGEKFDVAARIGRSYEKVGILLLLDDNEVQNIWTDSLKEIEKTNVEILRRWLRGSGKQPVTWRTLIQVLVKVGSTELAKDIREALIRNKLMFITL